jgi:hypothetical protein
MLFTENKLYEPFNERTGSSHELKNLNILDITDWLKDQSCYASGLFLKAHPKTQADQSLLDNLYKITSYFGKSILVYPSDNTYLLHSNNYAYKIWDNFWSGPVGYLNKSNLYNNFPVDKNTPLEQVPTWIVREWLSYNFFNSMNDQIEWFLPDRIKNKNCLIIFINDLLYDLENTVEKIKNFIDMPMTKNINSILLYHKKNLSLQKYLNQDAIANKIVTAIKENDTSLSWNSDQLTIITESWIQQWIRTAGYDFKCFELNQFPTTSKELIQLL